MSTTTILATILTAGVVGAGAAVTPFATSDDDSRDTWHGQGMHMRSGDHDRQGRGADADRDMGRRSGMSGGMDGMGRWTERGDHHRNADRDCDGFLGGTVTELSPAQARALARQAEMEKLSHDVYLGLADVGQDPRFTRIAQSENRHLSALRTLMDRHGVEDPTAGKSVGEFTSKDLARRYHDYLDRGTASPAAALEVAREVERHDMAGLEAAAKNLDAPDLERVFDHLADASRMHLEALDG